ncbi:hypothetical protein ME784_08730 [Lactobacillus delbrueckii]|uniref:hypothetical protein n=1 Tax=Lactobacillus delbrueckii TaxID=1584 RepID=UPI001F273805|nr:hypothetical protein [Lactobacillus delbrueckii]GHN20358.1 hypothetical protein ME784_08730 [Lactobacillus delbrueckii]GHN21936.1 hypothetical protein ME785_04940 [Lactobacillus delbrueckii]
MKLEEEIARVELDAGLKEVDDGDKNEALAKLAFIFSLELMEKNNLSLTEQEGTQLGMALTTIMVNMTEHGRLTQEQLAQECKNILLQKNRRIIAEGDGRLGPGELQELLAANNMSEEEFAAR